MATFRRVLLRLFVLCRQGLAGWPMDLKLGARMLVKSPGLTIVAVLALSVAIGGGVTYLELVSDTFNPTLSLPNGERIVGIQNWDAARGQAEPRALHDFLRWRESATSFDLLGAHTPFERTLITDDGRAEPVRGVEISPSAFRLVPATPLLGRPLISEDERPSAAPVAVIGYQLWQSRFAGDPRIVGRGVRLGQKTYTVVGLMPRGFGFPVNQSLWVPLQPGTATIERREGPPIKVFGRLAPGVGIRSAESELEALALRIDGGAQGDKGPLRPQVKPYVESLLSSQSDSAMERLLIYAVNIVFLSLLGLCGANVSTLVFARTATRGGEITVRTALGASRGRIISQLFAEALVLTAVAAAVGVLGAALAVRAVKNWVMAQGWSAPFWWNDSLSATAILYAAALAVLAAAIIGIVPGLKATGPEMQARLKHAGSGGSGMKFGRVWTGVIVGQVAVTVLVLLGIVSLSWNVYAGRNGLTEFRFEPSQYLTLRLEMDQESAASGPFRSRFLNAYREVERRLEAGPGIAGVSYATKLPGTNAHEFWVELDGVEPSTRPKDGPLWVRSSLVSHDFFETFDAGIVRGRAFTPAEAAEDLPVAIVDETFVRVILGGRDPIGLRIRHSEGATKGPWLAIVGIVESLTSEPAPTTESAALYRPVSPGGDVPIHVVVRTTGDAAAATHRVRTIAASADPSLRLYDVMPLDDLYRSDLLAHKVLAQALSIIGAVALLLATAGVYSLMSFTLARRTREIGIRAALGASPRRIVTSIFSRAFRQVGLGLLAGSAPGAALVTFGAPEVAEGGGVVVAAIATAAVASLIAIIALFACTPPARRALRIQPTEALRADL